MRLRRRAAYKGGPGATLIELLIAMGVLTLVLGAVLALQLQGLKIYQDVAASDWASFGAATAVERLEEDIQQCFRVTGRHTDTIVIAMPLLAWDDGNEMNIPVEPLAAGERISYYLSDTSGHPSLEGTYLWRATKLPGQTAFVRDIRPLAADIQKLQFTYEMMPAPREASVGTVNLLIKVSCKEGGVVRVRSHCAQITLRNAGYGPVTHESGLDSPDG